MICTERPHYRGRERRQKKEKKTRLSDDSVRGVRTWMPGSSSLRPNTKKASINIFLRLLPNYVFIFPFIIYLLHVFNGIWQRVRWCSEGVSDSDHVGPSQTSTGLPPTFIDICETFKRLKMNAPASGMHLFMRESVASKAQWIDCILHTLRENILPTACSGKGAKKKEETQDTTAAFRRNQ